MKKTYERFDHEFRFITPVHGYPYPVIDIYHNGKRVIIMSLNTSLRIRPKDIAAHSGLFGPSPAKQFFTEHGVTVTVVAKYVRKVLYNLVAKPLQKHKWLFVGGGAVSVNAIRSYMKHFDILEAAEQDGLLNITPILALLGCTPQEARKLVGKGLWKSLCKNSLYKNTYLYKRIAVGSWQEEYKDVLQELRKYNAMPVAALKHSDRPPEFLLWLKRNKLISNLEKPVLLPGATDKTLYALYTIYRDTKNMARQMHRDFNEGWSLRRMEEEHEACIRAQNAWWEQNRAFYQKYTVEPIADTLPQEYGEWGWEEDGVKATLLKTRVEVSEEGSRQKHCVGSYWRLCSTGNYLVVSLVGEKEKTTLGLTINNGVVNIDQHYATCNQPVQSVEHKTLAQKVLVSLQKQTKKGTHDQQNTNNPMFPLLQDF